MSTQPPLTAPPPESVVLARLLTRIERLSAEDFARAPFDTVVLAYDDWMTRLFTWESLSPPPIARILRDAYGAALTRALARYTSLADQDASMTFGRGYHYARALAVGCLLAVAAEQGAPAPPNIDEHFRALVRPILNPPTPHTGLRGL